MAERAVAAVAGDGAVVDVDGFDRSDPVGCGFGGAFRHAGLVGYEGSP